MGTQVRSGAVDAGEARAGDEELVALMAAVEEAERALAVAVSLAGRVAGSGASERRHGLPLDLLLAAEPGCPGWIGTR